MTHIKILGGMLLLMLTTDDVSMPVVRTRTDPLSRLQELLTRGSHLHLSMKDGEAMNLHIRRMIVLTFLVPMTSILILAETTTMCWTQGMMDGLSGLLTKHITPLREEIGSSVMIMPLPLRRTLSLHRGLLHLMMGKGPVMANGLKMKFAVALPPTGLALDLKRRTDVETRRHPAGVEMVAKMRPRMVVRVRGEIHRRGRAIPVGNLVDQTVEAKLNRNYRVDIPRIRTSLVLQRMTGLGSQHRPGNPRNVQRTKAMSIKRDHRTSHSTKTRRVERRVTLITSKKEIGGQRTLT